MAILTLVNLVRFGRASFSFLDMGDSENRSMKAAFVKWQKRLKVLLI